MASERNGRKDTAGRIATAPYNFVSLPQGVLTAPFDGEAKNDEERVANYRRHVMAPGRLSGRIELHLETLTSLFIGAAGEEFFSPRGTPVIPGSTIRGLVKNLFKIVTCGAMRGDQEDYEDRVFYFRTMAESDRGMRDLYTNEMSALHRDPSSGKCSAKTKADPGYLIRQISDRRYYICPTEFEVKADFGRETMTNQVRWDDPCEGWVSCYTGGMRGKESHTVHHAGRWGQRIPVSDETIAAYRDDKNRTGVDLLGGKVAKKGAEAASFTGDPNIDFVVPCFYKKEKNAVSHFGFGRFYRIPYHQRVHDHVIGMGTEAVDYADALFGRRALWGSRLSFTDAVPEGEVKREEAAYPKVLNEPKPTAVQLYLEQKKPSLAHWDTLGVPIRGYKLYWHQKNGTDWRNPEQTVSDVNPKRIRPVRSGSVFTGSIRFEGLSEEELGALLKVFRLGGDTLCCKMGKGKSIGLGSVRITAKLSLVEMEDSYRTMFDDKGDWYRAEREADMASYIAAFDREMKERLSKPVYERWAKAQEELIHLLDWKNTEIAGWEKKTAQMSLEDPAKPFSKRWILPTAREVK